MSIISHKDRLERRAIEAEQIRRLQQEIWQKDPMAWLKERFHEDPLNFKWSERAGYRGHKWDGDKDPLYGAWQSIADGRWAGIEAATGTSKTYMLARVVYWFLDCFPDSLVVTSAPKQAQLSLNLWSEIGKIFPKFKRVRPKAALYNLRLVVEEEDINKRGEEDWDDAALSDSWQAVGFVCGVGSLEQAAVKAQGFHRKHMLIITEETPGMPQAIMNSFRNTCSNRRKNLILAVGNPDNQLDVLHKFVSSPNVRGFQVSGYDFPNVVEKDPDLIPGAITQSFIDEMAIDLGENSSMFKSRCRGISPSESSQSLIKLSWVKDAFTTKLEYDGGYHAVGVDVANSEKGDKACFTFGEGNICKEVHEFHCDNATHLAYNLVYDAQELTDRGYTDYGTRTIHDYNIMDGYIAVDAVGIGIATVNALMDLNYNPVTITGGQWDEVVPQDFRLDPKNDNEIQKPKYKFQNLRSQIYWELREDLRHGRIWFDLGDDKELMEEIMFELTTPHVKFKGNFVIVEGKDDIKKRSGGKSPNKADSIAYWNWARKGYRVTGGIMPIMG